MVLYCAGRAPADDVVNLAHGGRPDAPQHGQDFQFGVGGSGRVVLPYTKTLLVKFSYVKQEMRGRGARARLVRCAAPL